MDLIYWSVFHQVGGEGMGKGNEGGFVILASCKHHFFRVHENLVQHPSNNISLVKEHVQLQFYVLITNINHVTKARKLKRNKKKINIAFNS